MLSDENVKVWETDSTYSVSKYGIVIYTDRRHMLSQICHRGYYSVSLKYKKTSILKPFKTIRNGVSEIVTEKMLYRRYFVHRLVAELFCYNDDPINKTEVNHIDGNPSNNRWDNLEWVTPSQNIRHSVDNGLRLDNIQCRVRDFNTGIVTDFSSVAEAKRFMGVPINTRSINLVPKRFGQLVNDRYEFKFSNDNRPWFYENRKIKVSSKHIVTVRYPDGRVEEYFKVAELPERFSKLPSVKTIATMPEMVVRARQEYPELEFMIRFAHDEDIYASSRKYIPGERTRIIAFNSQTKEKFVFQGLIAVSEYFHISNRAVRERIKQFKPFNREWYFVLATDTDRLNTLTMQFDYTAS